MSRELTDCLRSCESRIYEYVLPSYCLLPPVASDPLAIQLDQSSPGWRDGLGVAAEFADAGVPFSSTEGPESGGTDQETPAANDEQPIKTSENGESKSEIEGAEEKQLEDDKKRRDRGDLDNRSRGEYERRRGWRVDKETLDRFRALISQYTGTQ